MYPIWIYGHSIIVFCVYIRFLIKFFQNFQNANQLGLPFAKIIIIIIVVIIFPTFLSCIYTIAFQI